MKKYYGFTLIEILIVGLILGVLSAIAFPSYQSHILRVNRTDVKLALSAFSSAMESHFSREGNYVSAAIDSANKTSISSATAAHIFPPEAPLDRLDKLYLLRIIKADAYHYVIQAIPINNKKMQGDGFFQLDSYGLQAWDKNDSGAIDKDEWCWEAQSCL